MLKKNDRIGLFLSILISSILILSGCTKPPTQEVEKAEKAIAEAKQKEAHLYVQDIFTKAEESLKKAKDLITEKKYKEAKVAAEEALRLAQQVIPLIEENKKKMKAEVEQLVQDVFKEMAELKALIAKTFKKKTVEEQKEIQGMIGKWEIDYLVTIKEMVQTEKIRQAYDGLKAMKDQLSAQKEKMAAPPEAKTEKK